MNSRSRFWWNGAIVAVWLVVIVLSLWQTIPRYSRDGSEADFLVEHWYYGFPFLAYEYHENPFEGLGITHDWGLFGNLTLIAIPAVAGVLLLQRRRLARQQT